MDVKVIAVSIMVTCVAQSALSGEIQDAFLTSGGLLAGRSMSPVQSFIVGPVIDPCPDPVSDCGMPGGMVTPTAGTVIQPKLYGWSKG